MIYLIGFVFFREAKMKKNLLVLTFVLIGLILTLASCQHEHKWSNWETTKKATCTETGIKERYCSCGEKMTRTVKKRAHIEVIDEAIEPTCKKAGLSIGIHCSACDEVFVEQEVLPMLDHKPSYRAVCGNPLNCIACGDKIEVYDGHAPSRAVDPCSIGQFCLVCGVEVVTPYGHTEVIDPYVPNTCTQEGLTEGKHCSECGVVIVKQETIYAMHKYEKTVTPPTKTEKGYETYTCEVCGDGYTQATEPAIGSVGFTYEVYNYNCCRITGIGTCTDTEIYIPERIDGYYVTAIASCAFYNCEFITEIHIHQNIKQIGTQIFEGCKNLTTVYYAAEYGDYNNRFLNAPHIKKVIFDGRIVPSYILMDCANVQEVEIRTPYGIFEDAFKNCTGLTSIVVSESVVFVQGSKGTFEGCTNLKTVEAPGYLINLIPQDSLEILIINRGDEVQKIRDENFVGCDALKNVTISNSVRSIGYHAFAYCSNLTSINFEGTVSEWNAIQKDALWCEGSPITKIICANGEITLG